MAGQQETGLGEIVQPPPPAISPPPVTLSPPATSLPALPFSAPLDTTPSTSTNLRPSVPTIVSPSAPLTVTQQASARGQRARSLKNDFLVSDADTRSVLQDISNSYKEKNKLSEREMRRSHLQRLHSSRMAKHIHMGPKN